MPADLALGFWNALPHIVSMFHLPNLLSVVRLLLVPVLLSLAWHGHPRFFLCGLIASLASDAADGFLARRFNQTSELDAKLDSWADFITYLAPPVCGWWLRPEVVREERLSLGVRGKRKGVTSICDPDVTPMLPVWRLLPGEFLKKIRGCASGCFRPRHGCSRKAVSGNQRCAWQLNSRSAQVIHSPLPRR